MKKITIWRLSDPGDFETGRSGNADPYIVSGTQHEQRHILQIACKYGRMDVSMMKQMKELEDENRRLKKMYAEERLKAEMVQEALNKSSESPISQGTSPPIPDQFLLKSRDSQKRRLVVTYHLAFVLFGWGTRIRTLISGVRVRCPAVRRFPNKISDELRGTSGEVFFHLAAVFFLIVSYQPPDHSGYFSGFALKFFSRFRINKAGSPTNH